MEDIRALFLGQSMRDCEKTFADAVRREGDAAWDWLVVTAANEAQAEAYRAQIAQRLEGGLLPRQTRYVVIPDPDGKRVGSGGATLNVLREIARMDGGPTPFSLKRILVLHSGGDSQRIPQYSACGKLFAHVPRALADGRPSTLFDEFCIALSCVPARMNGGMLLMSGDVLLLFNALQIDLERLGAACLSIKAPVTTGTRHGVFLPDEEGGVLEFLHKQPEAVLRARGAVNKQDMVDIDTGAVWLDETRVQALYGLVSEGDEAFAQFVNEQVRLSLYGDFVYPMSAGATLETYLDQAPENVRSEALDDCRRAIWQAIGGTKLALIRLAPAEFIHFGTTREWRDLMLTGEERFGFLGWRRDVMSVGAGEGYAAINSIVEPGARIGAGCVLEDSHILAGASVGAGCIVSGAVLTEGMSLPENQVLHALPLVDGAVCARVYGIDDNPKEASRFGQALAENLWTAPLHPAALTLEDAVQMTLTGQRADRALSLCDSFTIADMQAVLENQEALTEAVRTRQMIDALHDGKPVQQVLSMLPKGSAGDSQVELLEAYAESAAFPLRHRIYYTLAQVLSGSDPVRAQAFEDACWRSINAYMLEDARQALAALPAPRIVQDRAEVTLPVRVNWGGGWSDTPPYCLQYGGTVLNASLLLEGQEPIYALAERLDEPVIRIESDDLGVHRTYHRLEDLATGNPHDPHVLCKAGLVVCGVVPGDGQGELAPLLQKMGGGIRLKTSVQNVPKGSGLGTSSIVSAAVARALSRLLGQPDDHQRIASLTLCMEQIMNTGGGWQDQIGGLVPGIKLTFSPAGLPQRLQWRHLQLTGETYAELGERMALVFTGQRRLAQGLLRDIMGKVVAANADALQVLSEIQQLAVLMAFALEKGDVDEFARLLREHWALSKRLDAGSSNTCIEHMTAVCDDLIDGMMICGAGGGGFMFMVMKRGVTRQQLSRRLEGVFQESGVKVWNAMLER